MTGRVKNVNELKGFGFILGDDDREYFFHRSNITDITDWDRLKKGVLVVFEPTEGQKGPRAESVVVS